LATDQLDNGDSVQGTQSVRRAIAILRLVAQGGKEGRRANDIATLLGLNLATVERLLRALGQEQLIERDPATRAYRIGPEVPALGASRLSRFSLTTHFQSALQQIAKETGDTVYLWARSGDEAVCVARREGSYPIRALAVEVGDRRPLGVGAGPLGQMLALAPDTAERIIARQSASYAGFGLSADKVREMIARARSLGFAFNEGEIIPEMGSIGVPVLDLAGQVVGSISLAAISARLPLDRARRVVAAIEAIIAPLVPVPDQ
jgi:DNA-binding IclR family transcriptional regulator